MAHSNAGPSRSKPKKPYPSFPLYAHGSGQWAKKIRHQTIYFGSWSDPDAALQRYHAAAEDLHAGRTPKISHDGLTVRDLCNSFLTAKRHQVDTGEITARTFGDYHATCGRVIKAFGLRRLVDDLDSHDFRQLRETIAKRWGVVALGNEVQRVRVLFNYAYQSGLIDKPMRYGTVFKRPSKKVLRKARQAKGPRMFEADQIRALLDGAPTQLRAMILLGINCGFGNNDCQLLSIDALDLEQGWVNFPRPKTAVERRCPLWQETIAALQEVLAKRKKPKSEDDLPLVFITKRGQRWGNGTTANPISAEFRKLLNKLGIHRPGLGFYALRHTVETIGSDACDQVALNYIMGHVDSSMAGVYREKIRDERLLKITDYIRAWLFP